MNALADELEQAIDAWDARGWPRPEAVLVTGSALELDLGPPVREPMPLGQIVPFPIHAVEGHALSVEMYEPSPGRFAACYRGRLHCYQGFDAHQVVFPIRLAALLGARAALLTNAAGSLSEHLPPGQLVALSDHLNLSGLNPLVGELPAAWGPRFPALDRAYDPRLRELAHACAADQGTALAEGVYAWLLGPSYETPAEIEMLRRAGADLVGMSTVPEIIAAHQLGLSCLALSLVTNLAAGLAKTPPSHQEVVEQAHLASGRVARLLSAVLRHPDLLES